MGFATGFTAPASILRCFIVAMDPFTSAATSPATTGPERPASAVHDALPRAVARSGAARFGGERRLAARRRGILEKARRLRILGTVRNDDVIEAEREQH